MAWPGICYKGFGSIFHVDGNPHGACPLCTSILRIYMETLATRYVRYLGVVPAKALVAGIWPYSVPR